MENCFLTLLVASLCKSNHKDDSSLTAGAVVTVMVAEGGRAAVLAGIVAVVGVRGAATVTSGECLVSA